MRKGLEESVANGTSPLTRALGLVNSAKNQENLKHKTRQHSLVKDFLDLSIRWEVEENFGLRGSCDFDFADQRGRSAWKSRVHGRVRSALDWQALTGILQGSDSRLIAT